MIKQLIVILLLSIYYHTGKATDNLRSPDVRTLGMGNNSVCHSPLFNPSLLAIQRQNELRLDYYNRYSMEELAIISGGFVFPNKFLPLGLHAASFGFDEYRENMFRFSVGKQLNYWCSLGIGLQYLVLESSLFESDVSRLSTDIGISFHPVNNWLIGLSIINYASLSLSDKHNESSHLSPLLIQAGFNWQFINDVLITAGISYDEETPFSGSVGMEYVPLTNFQLRMGIKTAPVCPSLGFTYHFSKLAADIVMVYHPVLGISTGIGLSFSF